MRWVFSEPLHGHRIGHRRRCGRAPRSCRGAVLGLIALPLGTLPAFAPSAEARSPGTWRRGSFPVAVFSGYTSPFGMRSHPLGGGVRPHEGLDIAAPLGTPVLNWWTGTVSEVISDGGCGNGLVILSGPYEHTYCHLGGQVSDRTYRSGSVLLRVGQRVRSGQTIGHVGLTGSTTGPHLHWGLRYRGRWLDPARVLRAMAESRRRPVPNPLRPNIVRPNTVRLLKVDPSR